MGLLSYRFVCVVAQCGTHTDRKRPEETQLTLSNPKLTDSKQ